MPHRRRPATSPLRSHLPKLALALGLVALALGAAAVRPAPAQAATPCWKLLLNDWYDGRIDQTYSVHCYKDALKHLPADVQTYSSAHDDILRALQTAIAKQQKSHKPVSDNTPVPPSGGGAGGGGSGSGSGGSGTTTTTGGGSQGNDGLAGTVSAGRPVLDSHAAADPRRPRAAARRGGRGRADRQAHPGAPPRHLRTGT